MKPFNLSIHSFLFLFLMFPYLRDRPTAGLAVGDSRGQFH